MIDDEKEIDDLKNIGNKYNNPIFVLNKIDLNKNKKYKQIDGFVPVSITNTINTDLLMVKIKEKVLQIAELEHLPMVINERYEILLKQCLEALSSVDFETMPIEIIAEELKIACDKIGQITGQIYTDDILDNIFSKFCIGK